MKTRVIIGSALLIGLAACGREQVLKPAQGHMLPPKPATAAALPDVETLLKPPPETRPARVDDVLRKSQERPDDRFDLPPPG